jgi:hypothetical protein
MPARSLKLRNCSAGRGCSAQLAFDIGPLTGAVCYDAAMIKCAARKRKKPAQALSSQKSRSNAWWASLPAAVREEIEEQIDGYIRHLHRGLSEYFKGVATPDQRKQRPSRVR